MADNKLLNSGMKVAFVTFELNDKNEENLADIEVKKGASNYYRCICDGIEKRRCNKLMPFAERQCILRKTLRERKINFCDKVYGMLESEENTEEGSSGGLTWKQFLEDHYQVEFHPSFDYVVQFHNGREAKFEDKVASLINEKGRRPVERYYEVTAIIKNTKSVSIATNSVMSKPTISVPEDTLMDLSVTGDSGHQPSQAEDEANVVRYSFGPKNFPGSKMLSLFEFSLLFANNE